MLIAFKLKLALACAAGLAGPLAVAPLVMEHGAADPDLRDRQAIVELHRGTVSYRVDGDFTHAGKQAAAPLVRMQLRRAACDHEASSQLPPTTNAASMTAPAARSTAAWSSPATALPCRSVGTTPTLMRRWLSRKTGET